MKEFTLYVAETTGNAQNNIYETEVQVQDAATLAAALAKDHVCAKYRGNRRSAENFEYSDCIPMDCDNDHSDVPTEWKTPEDVAAALPNVVFAVGYSRNNMKEKNGRAARPKFHVYFPIERITDAKQYVAMKKQILRMFPWFDANAADAARFYFGNEENNAKMFEGTKTVDAVLPKAICEGSRNATLSQKAACLIKRYGDSETAREMFLQEAALCIPSLEQNELQSIWNSARKFGARISGAAGYIPPDEYNAQSSVREFLEAAKPEQNRLYSWTDIGASRLFADCFKDTARYVPERKSWYIYGDGIWSADVGSLRAMELCKELADEIVRYALTIADEQKKQEYLKYCSKWQSRRVRETILKDAQGIHPIAMREFDSDPYIFNCKNGTLHLRSMVFTEHTPTDKLTKISDVEYNPGAKCERFVSFVDEISSGDRGKAKFLQKALGYGICGDTRYECLFILYGATTRNGKGTLCESVLSVLGSYGCTARPETISQKQTVSSQTPSEDIARLAGIRFTNISEPGKGLLLNAAQVKSMTGNDTLNARFLHENSFDFKPQFKLYINTNYLPLINDVTLFTSGRVVIIPFERHFEEAEQDKSLKALFAKPESQSAILNWLLEGYRLLHSEGLKQPSAVQKAIDEYRKDSDKIMQFVEEKLVAKPNEETRTAAVYEAYRLWCEQNGCYAENSRNFNQALRSFASVVRKRPREGGSETTVLQHYIIHGAATPLRPAI